MASPGTVPQRRRLRDRLLSFRASSSSSVSSRTPSPQPPLSLVSAPSPAPQSTTGSAPVEKRIIEAALCGLTSDDRRTIEQHITSSSATTDTTLLGILNTAKAKREQWESKRWIFTIGDRLVAPRIEVDKFIGFVDRIKAVGDVASNADPIHIGLPWAGVRLLLEVESKPGNLFIVH